MEKEGFPAFRRYSGMKEGGRAARNKTETPTLEMGGKLPLQGW